MILEFLRRPDLKLALAPIPNRAGAIAARGATPHMIWSSTGKVDLWPGGPQSYLHLPVNDSASSGSSPVPRWGRGVLASPHPGYAVGVAQSGAGWLPLQAVVGGPRFGAR